VSRLPSKRPEGDYQTACWLLPLLLASWLLQPQSSYRLLQTCKCSLPNSFAYIFTIAGFGDMSTKKVKKDWSGRADSNRRHLAWKARALPLSYIRTKNMQREESNPCTAFGCLLHLLASRTSGCYHYTTLQTGALAVLSKSSCFTTFACILSTKCILL
jgi:hypothetical protein